MASFIEMLVKCRQQLYNAKQNENLTIALLHPHYTKCFAVFQQLLFGRPDFNLGLSELRLLFQLPT